MGSNTDEKPKPKVIKWLLDTRPLWPVPKASPRDEVQELQNVASRALALLTPEEKTSVLKYYHVKDAKMSLGSHLLKHLVITKHCNVSWAESTISRDANGKPCFKPKPNSINHVSIDFNVSHQAGIVSLIAAIGFTEKVEVGTDVVCADERLKQDNAYIEKEGFFDWVDMHGDVFAESELNHMKLSPVDIDLGFTGGEAQGFAKDAVSRVQRRNQTFEVKLSPSDGGGYRTMIGSPVIDKKLRRFYAMWSLRETYVKMTGEALLAPWLKELEITGAESPASKKGLPEDDTSLVAGDVEKNFVIYFKGKKVSNVRIELTALGNNYMVGEAIRTPQGVDVSEVAKGIWEELDIENDVLAFVECR